MFRRATALVLAIGSIAFGSIPTSAASCSIAAVAAKPELGKLYGSVVDTSNGNALVSIRANQTTPSASVLKLFTGAAGLKYLPVPYVTETSVWRVVQEPGTIVLRGGGDHSLSRLAPPRYTTYAKPARIATLAARTLAKLPPEMQIEKIVLDDTFFEGRSYNPAWLDTDRTNGYVSPITALVADAGRINPDLTDKRYNGTRVSDPVAQAGSFFKKALGARAAYATVIDRPLPYFTYVKVASISSSPASTWIDHAMKVSDNTETEYIIRHVLKFLGKQTTYNDIQPIIERMLDEFGVPHDGLVMKDAAGLAQADRVTANIVTALLNEGAKLSSPIAKLGENLATTSSIGTISSRFRGANSAVRGNIQAKTGYIPGLYSLAGYVIAKDGRRLAFAFFARGKGTGAGTRTAIDSLVAKAYTCGATLTN